MNELRLNPGRTGETLAALVDPWLHNITIILTLSSPTSEDEMFWLHISLAAPAKPWPCS